MNQIVQSGGLVKYRWDLTPIVTIDQRDRLSISKWRGHGVGFFSRLMGLLNFQVNVLFEDVLASPPWGRRGWGFG
jgi:hypothetical protein